MAALLLYLVALGIVLLEARGAREPRPGRVPGLLWRAGLCFVLRHALGQFAQLDLAAGATGWLAAGRALVSLLLWAQLAGLAWYGRRTKAARVRWIFGAIAVLMALLRQPGPAIAFVALGAMLSFGWLEAIGTRPRFAAALGAIAVLAIRLFVQVPGGAPEAVGAFERGLDSFTSFVGIVAFVYVLLGAFRAFDAFVKDPTLGIRTIRGRLALSHGLVAGVPLLILAALWVITTWLGVNSDRAGVAMRAIDADANGLRRALAQALVTPGDTRAALRAVADTRRSEWPHVRVWRVTNRHAERLVGDPIDDEGAIVDWCDSLERKRPTSLVTLADGRRWLGAVARDGARDTFAVALVPVNELLAGTPARVAGARLWMRDREVVDSTSAWEDADSLDAADLAPDSLVSARARRLARAFGVRDSDVVVASANTPNQRRARLTVGRDTLQMSGSADDSTRATGAIIDGMIHGGVWSRHTFYLRAQVPLLETLIGIYRSSRDNPFNYVVLAILAGLVLAMLPVALFNFRMVGQLGRSVVQPVSALRDGTRALADARLDYRIPVRGDDELWDAARAFNTMSEGLERARESELARDRMEQELELARRIQRRLLPAGPPQVRGAEIAGLSAPAREVGGDYFDHLVLPEGRVLLVIADVSGKGVPAALLMSAFRASLISQELGAAPPDVLAARLNDFLHRSVEPGRFVTAFLGVLDPASGVLEYANAGHNPPVVLRADGRVEWLSTGGLILGILSGATFERGRTTLATGDLLALYTDGVTEGADASGEQFGEDRLVGSLRARAGSTPAEVAGALVEQVRTFEGTSGPADDLTVLLARVSVGERLAD